MAKNASSSRKSTSSTSNSLTSAFHPSKSATLASSTSSSKNPKQKVKRLESESESNPSNQERLRKPRKKELNSIKLAAQATANKNRNSNHASTSITNTSNNVRPSTPPPNASSSSSSSNSNISINSRPQLIGSPSLLGSPSSLDLFEPTKRSPVSVREDPDTGKLYLMMKNSRLKAAVAGPDRTVTTRSQQGQGQGVDARIERQRERSAFPSSSSSGSSPRKRKLTENEDDESDPNFKSSPSTNRVAKKLDFSSSPSFNPSTSTFPTTTPKNNNSSSIGLGLSYQSNKDSSEIGDEEEEFILRPGQNKGKRVSLGSPKDLQDPNLRLKARVKARLVNQKEAQSNDNGHGHGDNDGSPSSQIRASEKLRQKELRREDEMDLGMGSEIESDESQGQNLNNQEKLIEDRREIREDSEELVITPRDVRERPTGLGVSPASYATPSKASKFKANSSRPGLASSSSKKSRFSSSDLVELSDEATFSTSEVNSQLSSIATLLPPLSPEVSLSSSLPLPPHYSTILTLHNALEHSLVVHLATAGTSSSSIDSLKLSQDNDREKMVSIPNLITYTNLRPIVENSCGRRLGINEFSKLVGIWSDGEESVSSLEKKEDEIRGLGFIVNKTRTLDPKTGKKVWDWGIGIELKVVLPPKRQITPPIQVSFGNAPSTPPSKNNSGFNSVSNSPNLINSEGFSSPLKNSIRNSNSNGREGMSIIALWHNGIESRKNEVARRLQERCGRVHQAWLKSRNETEASDQVDEVQVSGFSTPSKKGKEREVLQGEGGLLTPAATRENGRRKGARVVHFDMESQDETRESDDEDGDGNVTLLPSSDSTFDSRSIRSRSPLSETPTRSRNTSGEDSETKGEIKEWHPSFNLNSVSPLPLARLPSLKESPKNNNNGIGNLSKSIADQMSQLRQTKSSLLNNSSSTEIPKTPSSSSSSGQLSLKERIKAKEDAKKAELQRIQAQRFGSKLNSSSSSKSIKQMEIETQATLMEGYKRRAILSRLSDVADAIYMLFTTKSSIVSNDSSSSSSSTSRRHSPTISISEILNTITKSTKVSFSRVEARQALDILMEIAPGFLDLINVGEKEWAKLGEGKKLNNVIVGKESSGSGIGVGIGLKEAKVRIARELVAPGAGKK